MTPAIRTIFSPHLIFRFVRYVPVQRPEQSVRTRLVLFSTATIDHWPVPKRSWTAPGKILEVSTAKYLGSGP